MSAPKVHRYGWTWDLLQKEAGLCGQTRGEITRSWSLVTCKQCVAAAAEEFVSLFEAAEQACKDMSAENDHAQILPLVRKSVQALNFIEET